MGYGLGCENITSSNFHLADVALGVDPGIANTGLEIIERSLSEYRLSSWELVKSTPKVPKAERVQAVNASVSEMLVKYPIDVMAVEQENISPLMTTSYIIGAVMCVSAACAVRVVEVKPQQVKSTRGLGGRTKKKNAQRIAHLMFRLEDKLMSNHIADVSMCAIAGLLVKK